MQMAVDKTKTWRKVEERLASKPSERKRTIYPGRTLAAMGRPVDDPDGWYLYEDRMITFWPYDDNGLLVGEDSYTVGVGFEKMRTLSVDEIPDLV